MESHPELIIVEQPAKQHEFDSAKPLPGRSRNSFPTVQLTNCPSFQKGWITLSLWGSCGNKRHQIYNIDDKNAALEISSNHTNLYCFRNINLKKLAVANSKILLRDQYLQSKNCSFKAPITCKGTSVKDADKQVVLDQDNKQPIKVSDVNAFVDDSLKIGNNELVLFFQAFIRNDKGSTINIASVFSDIIYKKEKLNIFKILKPSSPASGNYQLWIIIDEILSNEVYVCFEGEDWKPDPILVQSKPGSNAELVKRSFILMRSLPYKDQSIAQPVNVSMYLMSTKCEDFVSTRRTYKYTPNIAKSSIESKKRKRIPDEESLDMILKKSLDESKNEAQLAITTYSGVADVPPTPSSLLNAVAEQSQCDATDSQSIVDSEESLRFQSDSDQSVSISGSTQSGNQDLACDNNEQQLATTYTEQLLLPTNELEHTVLEYIDQRQLADGSMNPVELQANGFAEQMQDQIYTENPSFFNYGFYGPSSNNQYHQYPNQFLNNASQMVDHSVQETQPTDDGRLADALFVDLDNIPANAYKFTSWLSDD